MNEKKYKKQYKLYRENYANLPKRFINKLESDIRYLLEAPIPDLSKVYLFESVRGETSEAGVILIY